MDITILIPHYRNGRITAYTVSQLLKYKGNHNVKILISDNNPGDGSIKFLEPFHQQINIQYYHGNKIQSHGIALDTLMEYVETEYVLTMESDSFPIGGFLDYYSDIVNQGWDCAGSILQLSGGTYLHPAGALYRKSIWKEAKHYCEEIQYVYLPNIARKNGFPCHLMIRNDIIQDFQKDPFKYIELSQEYIPYSADKFNEQLLRYEPIRGPFHNGMGRDQEDISTYHLRNSVTGAQDVLLDYEEKLIYRIGYEPGQWFYYWQLGMRKKMFPIPTGVKWMSNWEGQQQEYTLNEAGIKHLWGVSAYFEADIPERQDIIDFKAKQVEDLYNSLPSELKI